MLRWATAWQRSPIHLKNKQIYRVAASWWRGCLVGLMGSCLLPELGLDVAGTGGAGLDLFLLLLSQYPLC